jgi:hypothetical protein
VEATDGLETILSFLKDEQFIKNNLKSSSVDIFADEYILVLLLFIRFIL